MTAICAGCEFEFYDKERHEWHCVLYDNGRKDECPDIRAEKAQARLDRRAEGEENEDCD